ncbi:DNA-binding protein RFX2 [Orchesella cincta]|uniref:DNA-binding protein RFX2 n=1 Tax=Orchesella cincta TaxID=48709 RepID=A0A1D2N8M7_ORCCI|nr:DNA-binding protein RFX2 [Orchesella cincta]
MLKLHPSHKYFDTESGSFYYEASDDECHHKQMVEEAKSFDSILWCVATICQQGLYQTPKSFSVRIILICGYLLSVICYAAYTGMIVSDLWEVKHPLKSLRQLLDYTDKIYLITSSDTTSVDLEVFSKNDPKLGNKLELKGFNEVFSELTKKPAKTCVLSWMDYLTNIAEQVLSKHEGTSQTKYARNIHSRVNEFVCRTFSSFQFQKLSYMYVPKNSELEKLFNFRIIIGLERGFIRRYWNEYKRNTEPPCLQTNAQMTPMDIGDVYLCFVILLAGMATSLLIIMPPPRHKGRRTSPRFQNQQQVYTSVSVAQVKQEVLSPKTPPTSKETKGKDGNLLSTPKGLTSPAFTGMHGLQNSMMDTTSPPIFSMDAITDVLGEMVGSDSQEDDNVKLYGSSASFLNDISTIEEQADSVATALFNASKRGTSTAAGSSSMRFHNESSAAASSDLASSSLPQIEHSLLESFMSPQNSSRCSSPIYSRVQDPLEDEDGNGRGDGDGSSSSNNVSDCSDSDFELEDDSSPPSDDSSDSDFNLEDSDSEYGAKKRRGGAGRKRGGAAGNKQFGAQIIPGLCHRQNRRSYHHQKSSKSKEQVVLLMGSDQPLHKPINSHQLEAIAATMGSSPVTVNWLLQNYETSEGNSLPRALMYGHYLRHCAELRLDPVNAASFGKLIRSVFVGLTTRRLGTRGNSKYHYCGIRIKDTSTLLLEDPDLSKKTRTNGKRSKKTQILAMQGGICGLGSNKGLQLEIGSSGEIDFNSVKKYLGSRCASFPEIAVSEFYLPDGVSYQDMLYFAEVYRKHCVEILEAAELFKLGTQLEKIWYQFWQRDRSYDGFHAHGSGITKESLVALTKVPEIQFAIQNLDAFTYDQVLSVLMPNVIAQLPFQLLEEYHKLTLTIQQWLTSSLGSYDPEFVQQKTELIVSFKRELETWVSLNLSAHSARDSMQSPNSIAQLLSDLNRINFRSVLMDVKEYVNVDEMDINVHESLKRILSGPDSIEPWSVWLVGLVDQRLGMSSTVRAAQDGHSTVNAVVKECQDLSLRWLKYMSQLKLELLLRSSGSLATFLSLELLFSNFLLHLIKVYKSRALQVPLVMYSVVRNTKVKECVNINNTGLDSHIPGVSIPQGQNEVSQVTIKKEIVDNGDEFA